MACLVRVGIRRILSSNGAKHAVNKQDGLFLRSISSRITRMAEEHEPKPKPWPYQEKGYNMFNALYDKTTSRWDENTKIIVVEGSVASGKSKFAKQLASDLEMFYLPEANQDMFYINSYGFDLKKLDDQVPESCRTFDVMNFLRNPKHKNTARFQLDQYRVKFSQYIDALAHLFSTGQGVILDRCVYSDFVFAEAMYSQGYLSKPAYKKYYEFRSNTIDELLKPHLVIYLDVPVPKIIENVKKRAISYEKDSTVLTPEYLQVIEKHYKQSYLKEISKHAELLVYDWSEEGDVEIVVEDIERIDFDRYDSQDKHLEDWKLEHEEDYALMRHLYADKKDSLLAYFNIPSFEVPELVIDGLDIKEYDEILETAPGHKYEVGYNASLGDEGIFFKMKIPHRETLPLRERRTTL